MSRKIDKAPVPVAKAVEGIVHELQAGQESVRAVGHLHQTEGFIEEALAAANHAAHVAWSMCSATPTVFEPEDLVDAIAVVIRAAMEAKDAMTRSARIWGGGTQDWQRLETHARLLGASVERVLLLLLK